MFDAVVDYDAVYVGAFPATAEEHLPTAFSWAVSELEHRGLGRGDLTVVSPTRDQFGGPLAGIPSGVTRATWRTLGALTPVIAAWPSSEAVEQIEDHRGRMEALCVLPWGLDDTALRPWINARGARDLLDQRPPGQVPVISDPVVAEAMRSLSTAVNLSTGLSHPDDKASAVWAFRILNEGGHRWRHEEIHTWAMANGWRAKDARELADVADGLLKGRRYQVGQRPWRRDVLAEWSKAADTN